MNVIYKEHILLMMDEEIAKAKQINKVIDRFELTTEEWDDFERTVLQRSTFQDFPRKGSYRGIKFLEVSNG